MKPSMIIAAIRPLTRCPYQRRRTTGELFHDMVRIARDGLAEVVNIKVNRCGGLTKSRRIRDLADCPRNPVLHPCRRAARCWPTLEAAHLAQSIPRSEFRLGTWCCQDMLAVSVAPDGESRSVDGCLSTPAAPGLGLSPDPELLGDPVARYSL